MIKVLVHGSNGKMGNHVLEAISKNENCTLSETGEKYAQNFSI